MAEKRAVLGLIEKIVVFGPDNNEEKVIARIDSGATASSIDFKLSAKLGLGPITRTKIVKSASGVKRRPIIIVKVRVGKKEIEAEFTLADRAHMTYPVLIGQNILQEGNFLIDPNKGGKK
ncbi:hypothetical protein HOE37_02590 [Candidatus Woesearchaeota archaeon]|jgi:hypothetical protein|nr:hypothetical protein [Candidatus Woesearchaeota archaeon]MBT4336316.1 hypothetical protein [Candidatus Woesearchaeota archaeon]MBT4469323.1 hypothetical protein [Candidatus Woesearchaeota archaeon]MBT6743854.1 hypothetical protein [Candidatus Woesearchaeota archaeon]